jgi:hypothetical protein
MASRLPQHCWEAAAHRPQGEDGLGPIKYVYRLKDIDYPDETSD